jgi:hypothetical protein
MKEDLSPVDRPELNCEIKHIYREVSCCADCLPDLDHGGELDFTEFHAPVLLYFY